VAKRVNSDVRGRRMKMFCINCGKVTRPKDSACTHCGFDLAPVIALLSEPDSNVEEAAAKRRGADEVAKRALILAAVTSCTVNEPRSAVIAWLKYEKLWRETTPMERKYLLERVSSRRKIVFSWRIEALVPLLWALNKIQRMPKLSERCVPASLEGTVIRPPHPTRQYIASASLRSEAEISAEYENIYQAHWKVRDAWRKNKSPPKRFDPEVVQERHHGFNWLMGYMNQPWDDVTTDT
jgi:hypothetical protein